MDRINLEGINSMDGHEFEALVADIFKKMEFRIEQTKKTADGGIDIIAHNEKPIVGGKYIIQCKRTNSPISESTIRDLYGVVTAERASKGILVTNSVFSSASKKFSENKPIELIAGDKLVDLLAKHFDFGKETDEQKLALHSELLGKNIVKIISNVKEEYDKIKDGLIFKSRKSIQNNDTYLKFFDSKNNNFLQFIEVLKNFVRFFNESPPENESEFSPFIRAKTDTFDVMVNRFFAIWKEIYFTDPPEDYKNVHFSLLKIYDSIFRSLFSWMEAFKEVLNNPQKFATPENTINLVFATDEEAFEKYSEEITEEFQRIRYRENLSRRSTCFIATACYGSDSREVTILKQFRDEHLVKNKIGNIFVTIYYKISPHLCRLLHNDKPIKKATKFFLKIIVRHMEKIIRERRNG